MFSNFNKTRLSRSQSAQQRTVSTTNEALIADIQAGIKQGESKDDVFNGGEKKSGTYGDNQFWKRAPEQLDVDALLAEME